MLWPRQTCAFGLPNEDDEEAIGDIVAVSIGHVLRVTATDIVDAPLPVRLVGLLRRIERQERSGRANATQRRKRAVSRHSAQRQAADRHGDGSAAVGDSVGHSKADVCTPVRRVVVTAS